MKAFNIYLTDDQLHRLQKASGKHSYTKEHPKRVSIAELVRNCIDYAIEKNII